MIFTIITIPFIIYQIAFNPDIVNNPEAKSAYIIALMWIVIALMEKINRKLSQKNR
jgi:hypothetical protein